MPPPRLLFLPLVEETPSDKPSINVAAVRSFLTFFLVTLVVKVLPRKLRDPPLAAVPVDPAAAA